MKSKLEIIWVDRTRSSYWYDFNNGPHFDKYIRLQFVLEEIDRRIQEYYKELRSPMNLGTDGVEAALVVVKELQSLRDLIGGSGE